MSPTYPGCATEEVEAEADDEAAAGMVATGATTLGPLGSNESNPRPNALLGCCVFSIGLSALFSAISIISPLKSLSS
jgi:hypothetical protein